MIHLVWQLFELRREVFQFQEHKNGRDQPTTKAPSIIVFNMLVVQRKVSIVLDALEESKIRDDVILWIKDVVSRPESTHQEHYFGLRQH